MPGTLIGFRNTTVILLTMLHHIHVYDKHTAIHIVYVHVCEKITSFFLIGNLLASHYNRFFQASSFGIKKSSLDKEGKGIFEGCLECSFCNTAFLL